MSKKHAPLTTAIGIHMDHEIIVAAYVHSDGSMTGIEARVTPHEKGVDEILNAIVSLCRRLIDKAQDFPVMGIGVSTIGLVHHTNGTIIHADESLPMLQNVPIGDALKAAFDVPVCVENNVNAMAVAEMLIGAGQDCDSFLFIHADAMLNGALVQGRRIWRGSHSSAGQIGQLVAGWMAERPIQLAKRASGTGIAADYNMRSRKVRDININDIIQFSRRGDQLAIRVIRDGAQVLGAVLSPVVNLLDPERVVVGGLLSDIGDLWWNAFKEALIQQPMPALTQVSITRSEVEEHAGLIGAGLLVQENLSINQK